MDLLSVPAWFADPGHWQGTDGIPIRLLEHVQVCGLAFSIACLIALPAGLAVGHTGRGAFLAVSLANAGRAIPSYAVMAILLPISLQLGLGLDFTPTVIAMIVLAIPPILANTYVGIREVDRDLVEVGRGMGMRERRILWDVELPLALPVIVAGLRTAVVQVIATATLGAVIALGGLGRYIVDGIARGEYDRMFAGVVLVAGMALAADFSLGMAQRRLASPGVSTERPRPGPVQEPAALGSRSR
jgi:osmoprotectant transport system permease protein